MNNTQHSNNWQFWIDRGGTFTDIVALSPEGEISTDKLLSENPKQYIDAAIEGIRRVVKNQKSSQSFIIKMGTTVATNALLERKGDDTLLVITKGFADALRIGYQHRPDLFALKITLPDMLYKQVVEADERVLANGDVESPLKAVLITERLQRAYDDGLRSIAIVFMHGYKYPKHEQLVADIAKQIGFVQISTSAESSALIKLVSRGDTTVVDAYLSPILKRYVDQVAEALHELNPAEHSLQFMQSNGGLTCAKKFAGKDAILSGPAGGVVGMVETATAAGFEKLIGFDMGGTSTDVCHYAGELERVFETEVAGVRMRAPMMHIHTVAAGGGSLLSFDGARFRVGPQSSGAAPGPACYGNNGPLSVTDCNVMLGKIQPDYFPHVFGVDANQPLNKDQVVEKFTALASEIEAQADKPTSLYEIASGFLAIAVDNMANAINKISVQRGYDVADYTLCCFGGAGGQHACLVADALSIKSIFLHPYAGVLSAYGMGLANLRQIKEYSVEQPLNANLLVELVAIQRKLLKQGQADLLEQGAAKSQLSDDTKLHCHYEGSDTNLVVGFTTIDRIKIEFEEVHRQSFGFSSAEKNIIVQSIEVEIIAVNKPPKIDIQMNKNTDLIADSHKQVVMSGIAKQTPFYKRETLPADVWIQGPAVVAEHTGTIVIELGWQGQLTQDNNIVLQRYEKIDHQVAIGTDVEPIMLEIFNNLFMSIAEQMGSVLEHTAVSVNIKERLDFSCAIFDNTGDLIANAPHMPVHLGSMSESIKTVIRTHAGKMVKGDAFVLNAPYNGGTHLPDVTIIKPVFNDAGSVIFYVASRGHHADIGGITPGSMPSNSSSVEQEGILLDNIKIVEAGEFQYQLLSDLLSSGDWPARNIETNIADFKAQLASCEKGMQALLKIVEHYSLPVVHAYMNHVQNNAEESVRRVISGLSDGSFHYEMDDGSKICVALTIDQKTRQATIDFTGTSEQHAFNFNAPSAITRAAVLYVFRCLVDDQIPLNEGCLKPLTIVLPDNCMINPKYPAAVVAGNVETSQAIVDCLLGALGVAAASQGTMNNVTWGNEHYQYYETICGGEGASEGHHGCSAVQSHMTNSRLTDPEVLESRFPVVLDAFSIRKNSGGAGLYKGGNGVERKVRFLQEMSVSLLTGHRRIPPYALQGGENGKLGENIYQNITGEKTVLNSTQTLTVKAGDTLIIKTPGGGGFGMLKDT